MIPFPYADNRTFLLLLVGAAAMGFVSGWHWSKSNLLEKKENYDGNAN